MHTYSPHRLALSESMALGLAIGQREVKSRLFGMPGATLRALTVAVALACSAGASLAQDASVQITSFTATAADFSGNFAYAMDPFQSYDLTALEAGGLLGTGLDNFSANDWNLGLNRVAQTANTKATGNTVQFTDPSTGLATAGFNLAAHATPVYLLPALPNSANASALQSGTFVLLDGMGDPIGGTITFDIFYDMSVATPGSSPIKYSQTQLNLLSTSDAGDSVSFSDGLLSNTLTNGTGEISTGHFTWTYTLGAGEAAYYTLSGSAIAVAAVPEPETYSLMLIGLVGIGAAARRRRVETTA